MPFPVTKKLKAKAGTRVVVRDRVDVVDKLIDRIVSLGGLDRLLERFDALTAPQVAAD